jgi:flagellar protein FlbD
VILVTRLNGATLLINPQLLLSAEATPDTVLTFQNGEKLIIQEGLASLQEAFIAYQQRITSPPATLTTRAS